MTGELFLCLDTSTDAGVALVRQGTVIARRRSGTDRRHAETLIPMISSALAEAQLGPQDVDVVVVGTGPAPFTGLRVGLATARTFAQARGIEALGVCSLDALALAAGPGPVLVVTDAKRRELYYARYDVGADDVQWVVGPDVATPEQIAADHGDLIAVGRVRGPGLLVAADRLGMTPPVGAADAAGDHGEPPAGAGTRAAAGEEGVVPAAPGAGGDDREAGATLTAPVDPADLVRIAERRRAAGDELPLTPRYLRRPDVQPAAPRKRAR